VHKHVYLVTSLDIEDDMMKHRPCLLQCSRLPQRIPHHSHRALVDVRGCEVSSERGPHKRQRELEGHRKEGVHKHIYLVTSLDIEDDVMKHRPGLLQYSRLPQRIPHHSHRALVDVEAVFRDRVHCCKYAPKLLAYMSLQAVQVLHPVQCSTCHFRFNQHVLYKYLPCP
jgi:hypothetical protein